MLSTITNYYERLVLERLHELLLPDGTEFDADYVDDLACVALNYLPPRYMRHGVDFASHLTDAELRQIQDEVIDAVGFALMTTQRRTTGREAE
ncbi:competence protein ComFB [Chromatium okenii]|uniref:late competence development ComFB family protein n=1 Tax=Chromatium okenii TaxID=61644 RepID=UPI001908B408|nr:late competence development ComFB family protein [Chromatium okenii]MBK1642448.1 competence protein ComFB [Chromatium okenii]